MNKSRRSEDLNVSVDDMRQSMNDVLRSRDMLKRAQRNLEESRTQFYMKKAEVLEGLQRTELTRNGLLDKREENKAAIQQVKRKRSQIERNLRKRHSELKELLERQFSQSLEILNTKSDGEINEFIDHDNYLKKQTANFDLLRAKIRKRVDTHDDFDLDFGKIQENVARLERLPSRLRSPPVSTLLIASRNLPLFHTEVVKKKGGEITSSTFVELPKTVPSEKLEEEEEEVEGEDEVQQTKLEEEEEEGIPKGDDDLEVTDIIGKVDRVDDDDDTISFASDVSSISTTSSIISATSTDLLEDTSFGRRKLSGSFRWTYQIEVEYVDIEISEKRKKRGTAFLVWDARLSQSFFVTAARLFREGLENVITNIHLSNRFSQDLYLGTASIRMSPDKRPQVAFLKIPTKYATDNGFSLVDTEVGYVGMSCFCFGVSEKKGKGQIMKNAKIVEMERKKLGLEMLMERELSGAPILSSRGSLVGMVTEKGIISSRASGVSINFVFNQYLKCFK